MMPSSFPYRILSSPIHDPQAVQRLAHPYIRALQAMGGWEDDAAPHCLLVLTGGTEAQVLAQAAQQPDQALILLAHGGDNSLAAAMEALAALRQRRIPARLCYLDGPHDQPGLETLSQSLADLDAQRRLRRARLGLVGEPSDWLVASRPGGEILRQAWGPHLVRIPMEELLEASEGDFGHAQLPQRGDSALPLPSQQAVDRAAALRRGVALLADRHRLDALTIRCFDLLTRQGGTGCLALAALNDAGSTGGCEGDVPATLGMLWARLLLDQASWMANPARLTADGLWLAHCTVPESLVRSVQLTTHFESGRGVGLAGRFEPGPVTLLRIGGQRLQRLWVAQGLLAEPGSAADLCRTQARIVLQAGAREELLQRPLGNHLVLVPGHHEARLQGWWRSLGPGRL